MKARAVIVLFLLFFTSLAHAKPLVVFDLDHTLINTNLRILAIARDVGDELGIPQLSKLKYSQIEALKARDFASLGLSDAKLIKRAFGDGTYASRKKSVFGRKFYKDSSYLKYDGVLPGAKEFVEKIAREHDAEILYLTGRLEREFRRATLKQLRENGFPLSARAKLMLKPNSYRGPTDSFKAKVLAKLAKENPVLLIIDDSKRNLKKLREVLGSNVVITEPVDYTNDAVVDGIVEQTRKCARALVVP